MPRVIQWVLGYLLILGKSLGMGEPANSQAVFFLFDILPFVE